jgi:hypothetical protein
VKRLRPLPVMPRNCATCPFVEGSPHAALRSLLEESALTCSSRVCHSTGPGNALYPKPTGKKSKLCRGARDLQLRMMFAMRFISAPTDEAWQEKVDEINKEIDSGIRRR